METFDHPDFDAHAFVLHAHDARAGLRAIIAVHDITLGPALGGCRIWPYASEAEGLTDVLRLSAGMSHKAALAGLPLGGGKSVILADQAAKTPEMMRAMGRAVEALGGLYIVAEDVGATAADMDEIARETAHVSGLSTTVGDPAPWTAEGVFRALEAAVRHRMGRGLAGVRVSVTGLGSVGSRLCAHLAAAGADLTVADIRAEAVEAIVARHGARAALPDEIHRAEVDVFAPCALGGALSADTIPEIRARIVCGAANNQLATPADDARLAEAGILYCPDYLVNAGGLISVARPKVGLSDEAAAQKLAEIPATLLSVFEAAEQAGVAPGAAADKLARARFRPSG